MVVPKLRFKEFDKGWNKDVIHDVFTNKSKSFNPQTEENLTVMNNKALRTCSSHLMFYMEN